MPLDLPINIVYKDGMRMIQLPTFCCRRCSHRWVPRKPTVPVICPSCKSPYWNQPRKP